MYKWFLAWRYLHTKLIAFFGVAAVTLCVAMVLVVLSVMGGFLDTVRSRSKGLHGEIVLDSGSVVGFPLYQEFIDQLKKELPGVVRVATPVIYSYGVFRVPETTETTAARVLGIRMDEYVQVNDFAKGLYYNYYYPGTTHLGKQRMPVAGFTADGVLRLPEEYEKANAKWRASEKNPQKIADYDADPFRRAPFPAQYTYPGERVFATCAGEPRYEKSEQYGAIIGCDLVFYRRADGKFDRHLALGADVAVTLMPLSPTGNIGGEPPVKLLLRYADDSRTGIFEIDSLHVYVDFDMLQSKLAMDAQERIDGGMTRPRANQLLVGLQPGVDLYEGKRVIKAAWHELLVQYEDRLGDNEIRQLGLVDVYTWEDMQRTFIAAVEKEKALVTILFGLISMVAIVLVGCIFYMIVEKKTRDIGIMKALGGSAGGVGMLFIAYAAAVGVVGAVLGMCVGTAFVWNINDIQDLLAQLNPQLRIWSPDIYSFDRIPEVVKTWDAIVVATVAVIASMVGSIVPAVLAGRVWPVDALRYE